MKEARVRTCISSVCLAWLLTASLFAADAALVVPQLSKPATAPADDDPFKAKYEAAWARYETTIGNITVSVNKALDGQFEKAADAGNLDLADMWDKKKKFFVDTLTLEWPSDGKAKTEWRKKYPDIEFPEAFTEVVKTAQEQYAAAVTSLKEDYERLVKDYTKERNLGRAKQLRDEVAGLERKPVARPEVVVLAELPKGYNTSPWVSEDGKRLYWQFSTDKRWTWVAERKTPEERFGPKRKLVEGEDGTFTADEKEVFVSYRRSIYTARRKNRIDDFSKLEPVKELGGLGLVARPSISPDGLTLWYEQLGDTYATRLGVFRLSRKTRAEPWGKPEAVRAEKVGMIRPKEQYGIFNWTQGFVHATTRDGGLTFGNPVLLHLPPETPPSGNQPFYCPATHELFFAAPDPADEKVWRICTVRNLALPQPSE